MAKKEVNEYFELNAINETTGYEILADGEVIDQAALLIDIANRIKRLEDTLVGSEK